MGSIANRDAAEQALDVARRKLEAGDTEAAQKFAAKSLGLYLTDEARALEQEIREAIAQTQHVTRVLDAPDLFEVLGVSRTVTASEAKKAYLQVSKLVHPDKNRHPSAEKAFQRLGEAHTTLSNPQQRDLHAMKNPAKPKPRAQAKSHSQYSAPSMPPPMPNARGPPKPDPHHQYDPWSGRGQRNGGPQAPQPPRPQAPPAHGGPGGAQPSTNFPPGGPPPHQGSASAEDDLLRRQLAGLRNELSAYQGQCRQAESEVAQARAQLQQCHQQRVLLDTQKRTAEAMNAEYRTHIQALEADKRCLEQRVARAEAGRREEAKRVHTLTEARERDQNPQRIQHLEAAYAEAMRRMVEYKERSEQLAVEKREAEVRAAAIAAANAPVVAVPMDAPQAASAQARAPTVAPAETLPSVLLPPETVRARVEQGAGSREQSAHDQPWPKAPMASAPLIERMKAQREPAPSAPAQLAPLPAPVPSSAPCAAPATSSTAPGSSTDAPPAAAAAAAAAAVVSPSFVGLSPPAGLGARNETVSSFISGRGPSSLPTSNGDGPSEEPPVPGHSSPAAAAAAPAAATASAPAAAADCSKAASSSTSPTDDARPAAFEGETFFPPWRTADDIRLFAAMDSIGLLAFEILGLTDATGAAHGAVALASATREARGCVEAMVAHMNASAHGDGARDAGAVVRRFRLLRRAYGSTPEGFAAAREEGGSHGKTRASSDGAQRPAPTSDPSRAFGNVPLSQQKPQLGPRSVPAVEAAAPAPPPQPMQMQVQAPSTPAPAPVAPTVSHDAMMSRLHSARLRLRPVVEDGRTQIYLASEISADEGSSAAADVASRNSGIGHVIVGRTSRDKANPFGVTDPRVSRRHVRVDVSADGEGLYVLVTAIGANPIAVAKRATEGEAAYGGAAGGSGETTFRRHILHNGERGEVRIGDMVQLVVEEKVPASGPSISFTNNNCVYVLEAGAEKRTAADASGSDGEGVNGGGDESGRPPKAARHAGPLPGVRGSPGSENREPQAKREPPGELGMSQEDPICL